MTFRDTIAAIATAPGEAGIAIVRISGSRGLAIADRVFQAALACEDGGHRDFLIKKHAQLLHGKWSPDPRK